MKRMLMILLAVVFIGSYVFAQEKIDPPIWGVGDKWTFRFKDTLTVKDADEKTYTVLWENATGTRETVTIYDRSTLNKTGIMEGGKRKEYKGGTKKLLDFPLFVGKTWEGRFVSRPTRSGLGDPEFIYLETFKVVGWEDVEVKAGRFKAFKIEYKQEISGRSAVGKAWYWYSPEVKYFVKCQYETTGFWIGINDWELISFEFKK